LHKAGLTEAQMNRLSKLRRNLAEEGKYQELIDYRRLQFVRWLVTTGKLTDRSLDKQPIILPSLFSSVNHSTSDQDR
jgi:hypothetical protein